MGQVKNCTYSSKYGSKYHSKRCVPYLMIASADTFKVRTRFRSMHSYSFAEEDNPEVDATYQACSKYLRSLGIENRAELARILDIAMNPNSLFHTFRDDKRDSNPFVSYPLSSHACPR